MFLGVENPWYYLYYYNITTSSVVKLNTSKQPLFAFLCYFKRTQCFGVFVLPKQEITSIQIPSRRSRLCDVRVEAINICHTFSVKNVCGVNRTAVNDTCGFKVVT